MVIADPNASLLTVCENGFGKRTPFGFIPSSPVAEEELSEPIDDASSETDEELTVSEPESDLDEGPEDEQETRSGMHYRRQKRGGKGVRDIRTSTRNGQAVDIIPVAEDDEVLMVTKNGIIQRVRGREISQVGRNTQGVRVIKLDKNDKLVSLARIPAEIVDDSENDTTIITETPPTIPPAEENTGNDDSASNLE